MHVGQIRITASAGNGEMLFLLLEQPNDPITNTWKVVVLDSTLWYANHFVAGSTTYWAEDWLTINSVAFE